jgi:hypothetical protein
VVKGAAVDGWLTAVFPAVAWLRPLASELPVTDPPRVDGAVEVETFALPSVVLGPAPRVPDSDARTEGPLPKLLPAPPAGA